MKKLGYDFIRNLMTQPCPATEGSSWRGFYIGQREGGQIEGSYEGEQGAEWLGSKKILLNIK
ncbi:MAG: hypothetical protein LBC41_11150, partial [Clostridiales bacterium]|nr:hypothetical protein [Clostridiales bacterium]